MKKANSSKKLVNSKVETILHAFLYLIIEGRTKLKDKDEWKYTIIGTNIK